MSDAIASAVQNAGVKNILFAGGSSEPTSPPEPVPWSAFTDPGTKAQPDRWRQRAPSARGLLLENTIPQVGAIRMAGTAVGPISPNLKLSMIATRDIGAAAADALCALSSAASKHKSCTDSAISTTPKPPASLARRSANPIRIRSGPRQSGSSRAAADGNVRISPA